MIFTADLPATGRELCITDGTPQGTALVADLVAGPVGSNPRGLERAGDSVYFWLGEYPDAVELWRTDGTTAGTVRVIRGSRSGPELDHEAAIRAAGDGPHVVFSARDPWHGRELWVSDGTAAGTRIAADSNPGPASGIPVPGRRVGDRFLFEATDGRTGTELHAIPLRHLGAWVASPIGEGCGARIRAEGSATLGNRLDLVVAGAAQAPGAVVLGFAPSFDAPRPACEINVQDPHTVAGFVTDASGASRLPFPVPNAPLLIGGQAYLQAVLLTPGGVLFGALELTEGLEVLVAR